MYTASKALLLLLLLLYYGKPIIKQISKTPRWKRKRHSTTTKATTGWITRYDMIIYVETSTTEEENIKKREITILYTERDMSPAGTP